MGVTLRSRLIACLTFAAVWPLVPSVAGADDAAMLKGHRVATSGLTPVVADGWRFATMIQAGTDAQVPNTSVRFADAHGRLTTRTVGCALSGASFGRAIGRCGEELALFDLSSLRRVPIAGLERADVPQGPVGSQWLDTASSDPISGAEIRVLLNWRTGERRTFGYEDQRLFDLNRARLVRLRLMVGDTLLGHPDSRLVGDRVVKRLRLRHGKQTISIVRRCPGVGCTDVQFAGGTVSWAEPDASRVCAYVVRTRRKGCWTDAPVLGGRGLGLVTHTTHGLFVSTSSDPTTMPRVGAEEAYYVPLRSLRHWRPRRR